ncbi:formate dehydrogenase accessory sulfurtransferase FdhD [Allokutzneria oryzae]|uniref:Sulfur carrier protein FdhD n=1 Tax=Allokutzneria oryzae TaxID=1378989 RepID=A0ABV6AAP3_9PSEU
MGRVTVRRQVLRISDGREIRRPDALAAEEPLELRVDGRALTVTMRTPGHDVELAHGFLQTEGVINSVEDVRTARYCDGTDEDGKNTYNVLDLALAAHVPPIERGVERNFHTTSACGVCGKAALESVRVRSHHDLTRDDTKVGVGTLLSLPHKLREAQRVFDSTGGLHAAGLFTAAGQLLAAREDVGRHNAVDKVIGWALMSGRVPLRGCVLMVSGRASFELVQKAAMAGVPVLAAVSAPSSLAADLAAEQGMTLVGFLRETSMNVYSGQSRVDR